MTRMDTMMRYAIAFAHYSRSPVLPRMQCQLWQFLRGLSKLSIWTKTTGPSAGRSIGVIIGARAYAQDLWQNHRDLVYSQCFNVAAPSRTLTHMMWIRDHEPENYKRIKKILFMKDYIRYRLTGDFVTDFIDAMGSLMMDVPNRRWSEELCAFAGLSPSILPKIINPEDIIGPLTPQAIADTGLSPRTKVVTGSTDTVLEVYANGAISQGDASPSSWRQPGLDLCPHRPAFGRSHAYQLPAPSPRPVVSRSWHQIMRIFLQMVPGYAIGRGDDAGGKRRAGRL